MITIQRATKAASKHVSRTTLALLSALGARAEFYCPACDRDVVGFFRYGDNGAWGCPACDASPRQRLVTHLLDTGALVIPADAAILHLAPNEYNLVERFHAAAVDYVPADLDPSRYPIAEVTKVDLMTLADSASGNASDVERFDIIYASHVMEHVPDDALVLSNIYRALKPGGEAWLIVPLWGKPTEDGSFAMAPRERERRFGQWDHVRQYGPDFAERIRAAGFELAEMAAANIDAATRDRMALDDIIFRARKPVAP